MRLNLNKTSSLYRVAHYSQESGHENRSKSLRFPQRAASGEIVSQNTFSSEGSMTDDEPKTGPEPDREPERVVRAEELFGDRREIWIELDGARYRLRITRRGKLILQK
jgi:hemin uptake protein HemP